MSETYTSQAQQARVAVLRALAACWPKPVRSRDLGCGLRVAVVATARSYLRRSGLVTCPARGIYQISHHGAVMLARWERHGGPM